MPDVYAKLPDGRYLQFPEGTDPTVIDNAVKAELTPKGPKSADLMRPGFGPSGAATLTPQQEREESGRIAPMAAMVAGGGISALIPRMAVEAAVAGGTEAGRAAITGDESPLNAGVRSAIVNGPIAEGLGSVLRIATNPLGAVRKGAERIGMGLNDVSHLPFLNKMSVMRGPMRETGNKLLGWAHGPENTEALTALKIAIADNRDAPWDQDLALKDAAREAKGRYPERGNFIARERDVLTRDREAAAVLGKTPTPLAAPTDEELIAAELAKIKAKGGLPSTPPTGGPRSVGTFRASASPADLVPEAPPAAPAPLQGTISPTTARTPVSVLRTSSKGARDAGEALSASDLQFLDDAYKIRLPEGTKLSKLREDVAAALLKARERRGAAHYNNAQRTRDLNQMKQGEGLPPYDEEP